MMPRVAEIKEIDGAIWCRVDLDLGMPISLYTEPEIVAIKKQVIKEVIYCLQNFDNLKIDDPSDREFE